MTLGLQMAHVYNVPFSPTHVRAAAPLSWHAYPVIKKYRLYNSPDDSVSPYSGLADGRQPSVLHATFPAWAAL